MNTPYTQKSRAARHFKDKLFQTVCVGAAGMAILVLVILLGSILFGGIGRFDPQFLRSLNSPTDAEKAGIFPALIGSIWLLVICALTAIPLGVGTAVLLEEYQPANKVLSKLHGFVQTNITNLAGVPSIVYGILGYFAFATMFGLFGSMQEPNVTIGQTWYHEYLGQDGKNYYVRVSGRDAEQRPPSADMVFYADARPGAARVPDVRIGEGLTKLKAELDAMSEQLKDLVEATRADSRSPAQIDQATAGQIADQVMAAADLEADPAVLKATLVEQLIAMDGVKGYLLGKARREAFDRLEATELAARDVTALIAADATPQARPFKRLWYFQLPFGTSVLAGGLTHAGGAAGHHRRGPGGGPGGPAIDAARLPGAGRHQVAGDREDRAARGDPRHVYRHHPRHEPGHRRGRPAAADRSRVCDQRAQAPDERLLGDAAADLPVGRGTGVERSFPRLRLDRGRGHHRAAGRPSVIQRGGGADPHEVPEAAQLSAYRTNPSAKAPANTPAQQPHAVLTKLTH